MPIMTDGFRATWWLLGIFVLLLTGPMLTLAFGSVSFKGDWRTATHRATGLAPDPAEHPAAESYPYASNYSVWPGPNSNTFIAHLGRQIPELELTLPSMAIGKDYLPAGQLFARTPSGTGYQLSLSGVVGLAAARDEGLV